MCFSHHLILCTVCNLLNNFWFYELNKNKNTETKRSTALQNSVDYHIILSLWLGGNGIVCAMCIYNVGHTYVSVEWVFIKMQVNVGIVMVCRHSWNRLWSKCSAPSTPPPPLSGVFMSIFHLKSFARNWNYLVKIEFNTKTPFKYCLYVL